MSMRDAGGDVSAARAAYAALVSRLTGSPGPDTQSIASELCDWLRFALGPGRVLAPGPRTADDSDHLAGEVLGFVAGRLRDPAASTSFSRLDLDLSGIIIDRADFSAAVFAGGTVDFRNCRFGPGVSFSSASFASGQVNFDGSLFDCSGHLHGWPFPESRFRGASVSFRDVTLSGGVLSFDDSAFESGSVDFSRLQAIDSGLSFIRSDFSGSVVAFDGARFVRDRAPAPVETTFNMSRITSGEVRFDRSYIGAPMSFSFARIEGGRLGFDCCEVASELKLTSLSFTGGQLSLSGLEVSHGNVDAHDLAVDGGTLALDKAKALFGKIDLRAASFLRGQVSMRDVESPFDGSVDLPWASYTGTTRSGPRVRDETFTGDHDHDFTITVARYRPGVITDWGPFHPLSEPDQPRHGRSKIMT